MSFNQWEKVVQLSVMSLKEELVFKIRLQSCVCYGSGWSQVDGGVCRDIGSNWQN